MGVVEFEDLPYWNFEFGLPKAVPIPVEDPLPSDSRFREVFTIVVILMISVVIRAIVMTVAFAIWLSFL